MTTTNTADVLADQLADWADELAVEFPHGSNAAAARIRNNLALQITRAVEDARDELEAIAAKSIRAEYRARELSELGLLPEGVTYSERQGLQVDGQAIHSVLTTDLGEQAGKDVDSQRARRRAAARSL